MSEHGQAAGDPRKRSSELSSPGWRPADGLMARRVQEMLLAGHHRNAAEPIRVPDEHGAFPSAWQLGAGLVGGGAPPVVIDANVLRNEIRRACRAEQRTVLVTATNMGAIRLYAASHVVGELDEHGERWAGESKGVSNAAFQARWEAEYRPLVREVRDEDLSPELLDPAEQERLARLAAVDPDDAPSVILSLALGAFFLSEDGRAVRAVYGQGVDLEAHREWLEVLRAGGDAGELGRSISVAVGAPVAGVAGLFSLGRWLAQRFSPWLPVSLGVTLAGLLRSRVSSEGWQNLRGGLSGAAEAFAQMYWRHQDAFERFRRAAPPAPTWKKLAETNDGKVVLARACLHALARSPSSPMSASELAGVLPDLGVGRGEALVREGLRSNGCFAEPYAGRWQVGCPVGG